LAETSLERLKNLGIILKVYRPEKPAELVKKPPLFYLSYIPKPLRSKPLRCKKMITSICIDGSGQNDSGTGQ